MVKGDSVSQPKTPIYMDYQATTPMDERVLEAMMPYFTEKFGNPHSANHKFGWEGAAAIDVARSQVSKLIGASSEEIFFTSGATEANNLALKGVMEAATGGRSTTGGEAASGKRNHLVVVATEHKCVLEVAEYLKDSGYELTILPVASDGLLDLNTVKKAVTENTAILSVMAVNNEIGTIQPLKELAEIAHSKGAYFHTDAAQGFGKIPLDVVGMGIDLMSISGHKIYGPKGIGAIYVRGATGDSQAVRIACQMHGGGQEGAGIAVGGYSGLRSGTQSPALCVGLGKAAQIAQDEMKAERKRIAALAAVFRGRIMLGCGDVKINGSLDNRYEGNLNISFMGIDGERLISQLRDLAVSSGAACGSSISGSSYVLEALGCDKAAIKSSIRFGFGRFSNEDQIIFAADMVVKAVKGLAK